MFEVEGGQEEGLWRERKGRRPWPEYLVFFEQLEPLMVRVGVGRGGGYGECRRVWNSRWHEDWRRTGDIVVWCLYPDRAQKSDSEKWREPQLMLREEMEKLQDNVRDGMEKGKERLRDGMDMAKRKAERVERVVEKPFWKQTPLVYDEVGEEAWSEWMWRIMGRNPRNKKRSWWEGGDWS